MSKTYNSDKLGPVTIPAPDETDNWQWVRAELALEIQEQRDELLAACKALVTGTATADEAEAAEAAIAKAEGRAQ